MEATTIASMYTWLALYTRGFTYTAISLQDLAKTVRYRWVGTARRLQAAAEGVLATVGDVQEAVLVLVLLVDVRHQGGCMRW